jgi:hypothetical protein
MQSTACASERWSTEPPDAGNHLFNWFVLLLKRLDYKGILAR